MTRRLLATLGEFHAPVLVKLALALLACALFPITVGIDAVGWMARWWQLRSALGSEHVRCPRGHVVEVAHGSWTCGCGYVFQGHAFEPCPSCGALSAISCPCGLTIPSPLTEERA